MQIIRSKVFTTELIPEIRFSSDSEEPGILRSATIFNDSIFNKNLKLVWGFFMPFRYICYPKQNKHVPFYSEIPLRLGISSIIVITVRYYKFLARNDFQKRIFTKRQKDCLIRIDCGPYSTGCWTYPLFCFSARKSIFREYERCRAETNFCRTSATQYYCDCLHNHWLVKT